MFLIGHICSQSETEATWGNVITAIHENSTSAATSSTGSFIFFGNYVWTRSYECHRDKYANKVSHKY